MKNKTDEIQIKMFNTTIDCKDPRKLADFYVMLMNWELHYQSETEDYIMIGPRDVHQGGYPQISFQQNPDYIPPVWPEEPNAQQQMMHLDFAVTDLEKAVQHAIRCSAKVAVTQFCDTHTVMLDPEEHPFCLCPMKEDIFEVPWFALL
jgi:hypothetical protein